MEVRECRRIDLGLELDKAYVVARSGPGLVVGMADETLGLEDLIVSSLVLTRSIGGPRGIRPYVASVKLSQEVILFVVGDALCV